MSRPLIALGVMLIISSVVAPGQLSTSVEMILPTNTFLRVLPPVESLPILERLTRRVFDKIPPQRVVGNIDVPLGPDVPPGGKHADPWGNEFGQINTIWLLKIAGLRIVHLGDNGPLRDETIRAIARVDVLMMPVDSQFHILKSDQIAAIRSKLSPLILIPMHYRHDDLETSPDKPAAWWYSGVGKRRGERTILAFAQAGTIARHTPQETGSGYFQAFTTCEATGQNKRTREMSEERRALTRARAESDRNQSPENDQFASSLHVSPEMNAFSAAARRLYFYRSHWHTCARFS